MKKTTKKTKISVHGFKQGLRDLTREKILNNNYNNNLVITSSENCVHPVKMLKHYSANFGGGGGEHPPSNDFRGECVPPYPLWRKHCLELWTQPLGQNKSARVSVGINSVRLKTIVRFRCGLLPRPLTRATVFSKMAFYLLCDCINLDCFI